MDNPRKRALLLAVGALVGIWLLAYAGYLLAKNAKMTAAKVRAYVESVQLDKLSAAERAKALQRLADMLNRLSVEERRQMRSGHMAEDWFAQMTEEEKGAFIDATMPTGFKQMISAFEEMPEDKRKRTIDGALKRLREQREKSASGAAGTNGPPPLSPELEAKVRSIGLKSFYSESSAQTKAELAPLLEELQRSMESGRAFRRR